MQLIKLMINLICDIILQFNYVSSLITIGA